MLTYTHEKYVPYADVDQMGFVYYGNYLHYFEEARSRMLRHHGLPYSRLEQMGVMLPVVTAHVDYKKPAHYEDDLSIDVVIAAFVKTRLQIDYVVRRGAERLSTGFTVHVCMSPEGRIMRPVPLLVELIEQGCLK